MLFTYNGITKSISIPSIKGGWSVLELGVIAEKHGVKNYKKNRKKTCNLILESIEKSPNFKESYNENCAVLESVKDSGKEEEDTEVVKDSGKEEEDTEVVKDSSKEEEDTEVVKDSSKEEEDTDFVSESVKDSEKEINELRNNLEKFNKIDMDTIKNIHTPIPEMKLLTDQQEMEFCSMKKLVDLSKPDNLDKFKIEYFIHNNIDSLDIDRGYIPYLNTRHAKISEHANEYSVIKSFMEILSHQSQLKGKKIQICQISTDQLTPHIKEMVEFLSAITGMDIQVINPMKLQIQRNTPVLMYNNIRFNIEIEEFENGYSLLKNDIEDIMNKSLIDRNNTVKSLVFISSHLFHVSNEISNKKYRFISTANEFDRINKIIFNTCMKILVKILLSMDIKHCSVYQCIMNKKDTIDAICPLCRYSIYKKTKVTPMNIAKRVNNLHIKNMGLIAMCKKYNKGFKL